MKRPKVGKRYHFVRLVRGEVEVCKYRRGTDELCSPAKSLLHPAVGGRIMKA
jgi:hypothetical protein